MDVVAPMRVALRRKRRRVLFMGKSGSSDISRHAGLMQHPPRTKALKDSQPPSLRCYARLPLLLPFTAGVEPPGQSLFCRGSRAVWIFPRVLLNRILNDQYVERAKSSHYNLPIPLFQRPFDCNASGLNAEARFALRITSRSYGTSQRSSYLCQPFIATCERLSGTHRLVKYPQALKYQGQAMNAALWARSAVQMVRRGHCRAVAVSVELQRVHVYKSL